MVWISYNFIYIYFALCSYRLSSNTIHEMSDFPYFNR